MRNIEFYFDPISPYVYFAFHSLPEKLGRFGLPVRCIPVLFAGLLNAHGHKGPAEIPAKRAYTMVDALRLAQDSGLPYEGPPAHPFNPLLPLRTCAAIADDDQRFRFASAVTAACWGKGEDITQAAVLKRIADSLKLDGAAILEQAQSEPVKKRLKDNTEQAIQKGVFGVPSILVDDQLFWGHDRIGLVERYLEGKLSLDPEQIRKVLARPRAADRK